MSTPDDTARPADPKPSAGDDSEDTSASLRPDLSSMSSESKNDGVEGGADAGNELGRVSQAPQVAPTRPIAATTPVVPSDDDDDFVPRGKTTQTLAGGAKKGGRPH